jgi:hydroxymethylbilane synthase
LTIGSRGSQLALWQANYVAELLRKLGVTAEIRVIKTTGDQMQAHSLPKPGINEPGVKETDGKGLFTREIEDALLRGEIDVAVHSLKDLPTASVEGLAIAAVPEREDPRDVLVGSDWQNLPKSARVGTSSLRRAAQLLAMRPDLQVSSVRGNVDTRLRKLKEGQYDAIVLAAAGLRRLGLAHEIGYIFEAAELCCAPAQGALGIQTRSSGEAREICSKLNDERSSRATQCERAVLSGLGGGCQLPLGAFARVSASDVFVQAVVASPDGRTILRGEEAGSAAACEEVGLRLARDLLTRGAERILAAPAGL